MARPGFTAPQFNGRSGGAGFESPRRKRNWFKKATSLLLAATALCGAMEANYQFQDFKGHDPLLTPMYKTLPESFQQASVGAADTWSLHGALRHQPVNALPDHVQVCIPNSMAEKLKTAEPGSPLARYIGEIEAHARGVAARHAEPDKSYGENEHHGSNFYGHWFFYANEGEQNLYENGQHPAAPLYAQPRHRSSWPGASILSKALSSAFGNAFNETEECGNTDNDHNKGSENYNQASYYMTHDGTKIPVPK